jgi:hypothetical protein
MKKETFIRSLCVIILVLCISGISAYAGLPDVPPAIQLQSIIKENVKYPENAVKNSWTGTVDVTFKVDEKGNILIKKISTDNKEIAESVKGQLSKINCKDANAPFYQLYKVTISFKLVG